jgi:ASC-1-like (ASCH) protein
MIQTHLAIFTQPYLNLILSSEKTIESRFSQNKIVPFSKIKTGDKIIMKQSGGLVYGEFTAGKVIFLSENFAFFNPQKIKIEGDLSIAKKFSKEICTNADKDFWQKRKLAKYATLIEIKNLNTYKNPRPCHEKDPKDRRAWIIL